MPESVDNLNFENDLTGQTIGDYLVLQRLGRGGMADVYLTRQLSLQRPIALKVLRRDLAKDATYVERFLREARAAAALVHANIVQIFEVGQHENIHFIAQEYISGQNLKMWLRRNGAAEPKLAMEILVGTSRAIKKADEFQVVHRDIKPENIMLSDNGEIKVTDFGLARVNNDQSNDTLTKVGITMGTPLYMSPEQVEGGALDARSDIYSLGVTAYHMLAGTPPFDGDNALTIAMKQVKNDAAPLGEVRPDLPAAVSKLIHRMIEKSPEDRPQSADEVLRVLKQINLDEAYALNDIKLSPAAIVDKSSANPQRTKLQQAMRVKSSARFGTRLIFGLGALAAAVAAWFGGNWVANLSAPADPLEIIVDADTPSGQPVPRLEAVDQQYESTYWSTFDLSSKQALPRQEAHWKAVLENFPLDKAGDAENKTKLYHQRAMARLGEIYLVQSRFEEAFTFYSKLANSGDLDRRFQVIGAVGKAIVRDNQSTETFGGGREEQESAIRKLLEDVGDDRDLLDPFLAQEFDSLLIQYPLFWPSDF